MGKICKKNFENFLASLRFLSKWHVTLWIDRPSSQEKVDKNIIGNYVVRSAKSRFCGRAVQCSAWSMASTCAVASIWTMPGQCLHVEATAQVDATEN